MKSHRVDLILNALAVVFSLLGGATLASFSFALMRGLSGDASMLLILTSVVYGILALATGILLYRRSELAPRVFLMWCAAFALFIAAVPEMRIATAIPGYVLGLVLFLWVYVFVSRQLGSRPGIGTVAKDL